MFIEADYYAQFEAYDRGELPAPARAALAAQLAADPALALAYAEFGELTATLRAAGQHRATRRTLKRLHGALGLTTDREAAAPAANAVLRRDLDALAQPAGPPQLRLSGTERRLRDFWHGHRATAGIAAAVAVMAVFATLLGLEAWQAAKTGPALAGYQAMRREINVLKRNQKALSRTISQLEPGVAPVAPINNGKFSGTGFALPADGYLVTSYHVIQGADSLLVEGHDRQRFHAETVYADVAHDLAILRITDRRFDGFGRLPYTFKSGEAELGERVYTLGYPREDVVYGEGTLSARSGFEGDTAFYQVSIPVNPGNSGGPLLDEHGNLIGVVSGRQNDVQGAGFATKSSYLVRLVDSLDRARPVAPYHLPTANYLAGSARPQQLKKLQDYVFVVKVFE